MARINTNYDKLAAGYLFLRSPAAPTPFWKKILELKFCAWELEIQPSPLPQPYWTVFTSGVSNLGVEETYSGYGPSEGVLPLRQGTC